VTVSGGFLDRIGLGAKVDISPATDLIVDALNGFSERIAGFVGKLDLMTVHIPTVPFATGIARRSPRLQRAPPPRPVRTRRFRRRTLILRQ